MSGDQEGLAASVLCDKNDPTRLTWKEIKNSYGSCTNFFMSFGLKPWDSNDQEEALSISRAMKANDA